MEWYIITPYMNDLLGLQLRAKQADSVIHCKVFNETKWSSSCTPRNIFLPCSIYIKSILC